ncbi:MAG: plasmid mobilization protein [Treponemataceae bacterium]
MTNKMNKGTEIFMEKKKNTWGGKRTGSGRKANGDENATEQVQIRFTPKELERAKAKADETGIALSTLCKKVFINYLENS